MKTTSPELAQRIVDLLRNDPGTANSFATNRTPHEKPTEQDCRGCGERFMPVAIGRQFCSRDCYDRYLQRKRVGKPRPKPRNAQNGVLGPGKRFKGEMALYTCSRQGHANADTVIAEIQRVYGVRVGVTTVHRRWRQHAAGECPKECYRQPARPDPPVQAEPQVEEVRTPQVFKVKNKSEQSQLQERAGDAIHKLGLSRSWLGRRVGVHNSYIGRWLRGKARLSDEVLSSVEEWLAEVDNGTFVGTKKGKPKKTSPPPKPAKSKVSAPDGIAPANETPKCTTQPPPELVIIRGILERAARKELEQLAPDIAKDVEIRIILGWESGCRSNSKN